MLPERITIQEVGKPVPAPSAPEPAGFDLQDGLIAGCVLFAEAAALVIWWPAALILAALFCGVFAVLIQLSTTKEKKIGPTRS